MKKKVAIALLLLSANLPMFAQSVARTWNEALLDAIRNDYARPTSHARNLFHISAAMYDAWSVYDTLSHPFLLGNKVGNYQCAFHGVPKPTDVEKAREIAISYASYRLIRHRFAKSPGHGKILQIINQLCQQFGVDTNYISANYGNGNPADLGNFIATEYINFGLQDGSNEQNNFKNRFYEAYNDPFYPELVKTPKMKDPNRWQQIGLSIFVDQSGNVVSGQVQPFLGPEWGGVQPFSLSAGDLKTYNRDGFNWSVYDDPGKPPQFKPNVTTDSSEFFKWAFSYVSMSSSHLDPSDGVVWDISPKSMKAPSVLPNTLDEMRKFYDHSTRNYFDSGYVVNPKTGQPYTAQLVKRGDFTRALAEFWADGPDSETPPGHWFTLLNYVNEQPDLKLNFRGKYPFSNALEWDVKSYLVMGGAMHDCAVSVWGIKGYYDYVRPFSAIRYVASLGQSSDPSLPNYNESGMKLVPGLIELVKAGDSLAGSGNEHLNKIKLYAWRGHDLIKDPKVDQAGVGWILAEDWWPYQRPTFVTPPFAGYVSGHSTFSTAGAQVLELLTGDPYFPGGLGRFTIKKNEFLVFEEGPSDDFELQWGSYMDAASQSCMSRIWGGIHPPTDDIPGRKIGMRIGKTAIDYAEKYFYRDADGDGVLSHVDCNDNDATIYKGAKELCDNKDNDCNGQIDDNIPYYVYYSDRDRDGFGSRTDSILSCTNPMPKGYSLISGDCNDMDAKINPMGVDEPDNFIDEDCSGFDSTDRWVVWPNPISNVLYVYKSDLKSAEVEIVDRIGQVVYNSSIVFKNEMVKLDVTTLIPGLYILRIVGPDDTIFHTRLIKQ